MWKTTYKSSCFAFNLEFLLSSPLYICISMANITCKYGIILSQMDYIFIDGIVILILSYDMTLCYLEDKLGKVWSLNPLLLSWIDILYLKCFTSQLVYNNLKSLWLVQELICKASLRIAIQTFILFFSKTSSMPMNLSLRQWMPLDILWFYFLLCIK